MSHDRYTHGHHASVLRSHEWRTAENSCGYLLAHLAPGQDLLDIGCGPGTITVDLAQRVAPGNVVGVDRSQEVIERAIKPTNPDNVTFKIADAYALPFADASFDIVHAHQVLQHVSNPIGILKEMLRVLRPGGIVAVREGDFGGFMWSPNDPVLDRWMEIYHRVTIANGAEADAGRHLLAWVIDAGFTEAAFTSSTWTFADPPTRSWWSEIWAERIEHSSLAEQALELNDVQPSDLRDIADAFRRWAKEESATFVVPNGEVIAYKANSTT